MQFLTPSCVTSYGWASPTTITVVQRMTLLGSGMASGRPFDKSLLSFGAHDGRKRVRRYRWERREPHFYIELHVHRTVGVLIRDSTAQLDHL